MCKPGSHPSHGPTNECVGRSHIGSKLRRGWSIGPCDGPPFGGGACGEAPGPATLTCVCKGKITSVTLTYVGVPVTYIKVWKNANHTIQIGSTYSNVATGDVLTLSTNAAGNPDKIYLEVSGSLCDTRINTKCNKLVVVSRVGMFDVTAWSDNNAHNCNGTATPLKTHEQEEAASNGSETRLTAYPNPFNESTTVEFSISESQNVALKVFNLAGAEIETLFEGQAEAGVAYKLNFRPENISSGIYISKLITRSGEVKFEKLILQR